MYHHVASIQKPGSLPSWLITTASREASRLVAAARRRAEAERSPRATGPKEHEESPEALLGRVEEVDRIQRAIARLGPRCRKLITLLYVDPSSPSYQAVAESLGMPLGSVGPTRLRCLARLTRILESGGWEGADSP